jgi:hypothetical protein
MSGTRPGHKAAASDLPGAALLRTAIPDLRVAALAPLIRAPMIQQVSGRRRTQMSHLRVLFDVTRRDPGAAQNHRTERAGDSRGALIGAVSSQSAVPYEPTTVPLTGIGPSVQRSLTVDANSPNAGSSASGL